MMSRPMIPTMIRCAGRLSLALGLAALLAIPAPAPADDDKFRIKIDGDRDRYDYDRDRYRDRYGDWDQRRSPAYRDDIRFLRRMADRNEGVQRMANLARDRARHEELRDFARRLEEDRSRDKRDYQARLSQWYDVDYNAQMDEEAQNKYSMLRNSPSDEFDIRFLKVVIDRGQEDIALARAMRDDQMREGLRERTRELIQQRRNEVYQARAWLKRWYDIDYEGSRS